MSATKYHKVRPKGPWDWLDWTLAVAGCCNIVFLVVMLTWALYDYPKPSGWIFVTLIAGFIVPGFIASYRNRDFCDYHGCEMEGYCPQCSQEQKAEKDRLRLAVEREIRLEEIAEGYRRAREKYPGDPFETARTISLESLSKKKMIREKL